MLNSDGWEYATAYHRLMGTISYYGGAVPAAAVPTDDGGVAVAGVSLTPLGVAYSVADWPTRLQMHCCVVERVRREAAERLV